MGVDQGGYVLATVRARCTAKSCRRASFSVGGLPNELTADISPASCVSTYQGVLILDCDYRERREVC
jgi:hypothetical protein